MFHVVIKVSGSRYRKGCDISRYGEFCDRPEPFHLQYLHVVANRFGSEDINNDWLDPI